MLLEASLALVALLAYLYWRWQQKSTYWTKLGVRQPPSNPFLVGNDALPRLLSAKNANRAMLEQYNQFKGPSMSDVRKVLGFLDPLPPCHCSIQATYQYIWNPP